MGDGGVTCVVASLHVMEHFSTSEPFCGNNTINTIHGFDIKSNSAKLATHRVSRKGLTALCCQRHVMGKITYRFVMGRQPPGVKGMSWAIQYHVIVYMLHEYAVTGTHL
uniref:Uncharacterized protein n=1 Tax=Picea sitchensis TaxID=3332 RepID=D5AE77_PICSI|nr:unknown [Picea sitchensis]